MNYYKEITKLLGLHWYEEKQESEVFGMKDTSESYIINNKGLKSIQSKERIIYTRSFNSLIPENIVKLPWVPELGRQYYYPNFNVTKLYSSFVFQDCVIDKQVEISVGYFRTPEEAQAKAKEMWGL